MKYIDVCVLCIKNVLSNGDNSFSAETFETHRNSIEYGDLINNIDIHINSAISRLITSDKLPTSCETFSYKYNNKDRLLTTLDLNQNDLAKNIYEVKYVTFKNEYGNQMLSSYKKIGKDKLVVECYREDGEYNVHYVKTIPFLSNLLEEQANKDLNDEFNISDIMITQYILNYTKAKLWETQEPTLSQYYMNYAENYLSQVKNDETGEHQTSVSQIYYY